MRKREKRERVDGSVLRERKIARTWGGNGISLWFEMKD